MGFLHAIATMGAGASAGTSKKEELEAAFKAMDKDSDGKLTKDEVKEFLQKIDPEAFTDEVCDALHKDADSDEDGSITVKELGEWIDKMEAADKTEEAPKEE